MEQMELPLREAAVNRIRSYYRTLENHRRTSIALHGHVKPSTKALARLLGSEVSAIGKEYPEDKEIQRWVSKFGEFSNQPDLLE